MPWRVREKIPPRAATVHGDLIGTKGDTFANYVIPTDTASEYEEAHVTFFMLHDFILKADERLLALSVVRQHTDSEQPHEAVGFVLYPRRLALRRPGHTNGS